MGITSKEIDIQQTEFGVSSSVVIKSQSVSKQTVVRISRLDIGIVGSGEGDVIYRHLFPLPPKITFNAVLAVKQACQSRIDKPETVVVLRQMNILSADLESQEYQNSYENGYTVKLFHT